MRQDLGSINLLDMHRLRRFPMLVEVNVHWVVVPVTMPRKSNKSDSRFFDTTILGTKIQLSSQPTLLPGAKLNSKAQTSA